MWGSCVWIYICVKSCVWIWVPILRLELNHIMVKYRITYEGKTFSNPFGIWMIILSILKSPLRNMPFKSTIHVIQLATTISININLIIAPYTAGVHLLLKSKWTQYFSSSKSSNCWLTGILLLCWPWPYLPEWWSPILLYYWIGDKYVLIIYL